MPHLLDNKHIAIVGAGPGGLTLARLLQLQGAQVKVYERDLHSSARNQGATLDLHEESGLKALAAAGLMEKFKQAYRPGADKVRLTNHLGELLIDQHAMATTNDIRPEIDRGPLRDLLIESLKPNSLQWNAHINTVVPRGGGWILEFASGDWAYADLVIAADGGNSKLRPLVTPIKPQFVGFSMLEANIAQAITKVPAMTELVNGGKLVALGQNQSLILSQKGDGTLSLYLGLATADANTPLSSVDLTCKKSLVDWFKSEFAGWSHDWCQLLEAADSFILRPQYCVPLDQQWAAQSNITLIGDAAHLMPPYAGEGVNMAMLDALELSEQLTNPAHTDLQAAIAAYETCMRERAALSAQMTLESMAMLHSPQASEFMASLI